MARQTEWLRLTYRDSGINFDDYLLSGFTIAERAEFVRKQFIRELDNPEGLVFSIVIERY